MSGAAAAEHIEVGDRLVRIACPKCTSAVPEPLPRGSLVPVVHNRGADHANCRFWVSVDPSGDDHEYRVLRNRGEGGRETFEGTIDEVYEDHRHQVERAVLAARLAELG